MARGCDPVLVNGPEEILYGRLSRLPVSSEWAQELDSERLDFSAYFSGERLDGTALFSGTPSWGIQVSSLPSGWTRGAPLIKEQEMRKNDLPMLRQLVQSFADPARDKKIFDMVRLSDSGRAADAEERKLLVLSGDMPSPGIYKEQHVNAYHKDAVELIAVRLGFSAECWVYVEFYDLFEKDPGAGPGADPGVLVSAFVLIDSDHELLGWIFPYD